MPRSNAPRALLDPPTILDAVYALMGQDPCPTDERLLLAGHGLPQLADDDDLGGES